MAKTTDTETKTAKPSAAVKIEYVGYGREVKIRQITEEDFKRLGVEHKTMSFEKANGWTIAGDDIPAEVVAVFEAQPDFQVTQG